jgi:hypothetical protein
MAQDGQARSPSHGQIQVVATRSFDLLDLPVELVLRILMIATVQSSKDRPTDVSEVFYKMKSVELARESSTIA